MTTVKFEIGKTYTCRSLCDYDCIFSYKVIARTAKQLTIETHRETFKRGIKVVDDVEMCKPNGTYSMCPVIWANQ